MILDKACIKSELIPVLNLFDIITAFPLDPASNEDRPKGSSHKDGATVMEE